MTRSIEGCRSVLKLLAIVVAAGIAWQARGHQGVLVTWNREVSRVFYEHCVSCHRDGGSTFSLMRFEEAQPRAAAIRDAVLSRRMPPWGAVKGFGDFANDQGLSQAQIDIVTDWVQSGMRRGNNPNVLPQHRQSLEPDAPPTTRHAVGLVDGSVLSESIAVKGLLPMRVSAYVSAQIVAILPNGSVEPLVWLYQYDEMLGHPFLFRETLSLPAGTQIRGIPDGASVALLIADGPR